MSEKPLNAASNMDTYVYTTIMLLLSIQVTESLHYYNTPALSNQFLNFEISTSIPSDGKGGTESKQPALKLAFQNYTRRSITFNFKGKGNARLQFFNFRKSKHFQVIIGGGSNHNKVYIYNHEGKRYSATLNGITREDEYRSFWIRSKWRNAINTYTVYVGLCSDPRKNEILKTDSINGTTFKPKIFHIRISTVSSIRGWWQFASAGQPLGGCGDGIGCTVKKAPKCDRSEMDWISDKIGLIGTCIPKKGYFSTVVFGSGKCRKVCGTGNEVCGSGETCKNSKCIAPITKSTTTTTTTTTTTATTTPTSTSTSMATVLHISTTTSATNTTTITTTPANTQTLPSTDTSESNVSQISISTSLTTIVSTAEGKSSFFLVSGWAIIAGTGGGLTTLVAIILVWWNCKPCCLCPVCVSRRVTPDESATIENGNDTTC